MRLTDDYQCEPEEEREQKTSKKPDKKELPKKQTKDDLKEFNEWVNREGTDIKTVNYLRCILIFKDLVAC